MSTRAQTGPELIARMQGLEDRSCLGCRRALCHHERLMSISAGFADAVRCVDCLARELAQPAERLLAHLERTLQNRECFATAWDWAVEQERAGTARCPWRGARSTPAEDVAQPAAAAAPAADSAWDAGDKGCGDLVLELRMKMRDLPPGHVLHLTATDPGAPHDIPAWCSLTGHGLVAAAPPSYWIRRRQGA